MNKKQKIEQVGRAIDFLAEWIKTPYVKNKILTTTYECNTTNCGKAKMYKIGNTIKIIAQKGEMNVSIAITVRDGVGKK